MASISDIKEGSRSSFDFINLEKDEIVLSHQNNVQKFQLFKNGFENETRYFGDIYATNHKILFIDRKLQTEFTLPFSSIIHVYYKKPYFDPNYIEIIATEDKDKIIWELTFEEGGAMEFKNQLKKLSISDKVLLTRQVSTESPLVTEIKKFVY